MTEYYETLLWCAQAYLVLCGATMVFAVGSILYERFVEGNVDVFKPERREGQRDWRAEQLSH